MTDEEYKQAKVADLKSEIVSSGLFSPDEYDGVAGKSEWVKLHKEMLVRKLEAENVTLPDEQVIELNEVQQGNGALTPDDPGWVDFVLSSLRDGEYVTDENGGRRPRIGGLKRLVSKLIGKVISSRSHVVQAPTPESVAATVEHTVVVREFGSFEETTVTDVADVYPGNMTGDFWKYSTACASTRAESRCLRKILSLYSVCSAEEVSGEMPLAWEPESPASKQQCDTIGVLCDRLKIDVKKLLQLGKEKYENVEDLPKSAAAKVIGYLSEMQGQRKPIPSKILITE